MYRMFKFSFIVLILSTLVNKPFPTMAVTSQVLQSCEMLVGIMSIAFSPDSKSLVAVGEQGFVSLWEVQSGKKLLDLPYGSLEVVYRVAFAPNGKYVAASTIEDTALWDAQTGKKLYSFRGDAKDITLEGQRIAFTPDSNYLLVSDIEGGILWDIQTGKKDKVFPYHVGWESYYTVDLSPNGKYVLANGADILLWSIETGEIIHKFGYKQHLLSVEASFSPDGDTIIIHANGVVAKW